jgi:hypothetical protein
MGRNLYILAATLEVFAVVCLALSFTNIAQQPGSPGDVSLWRTMAIGFCVLGMVIALAGMLSTLFEQAERRAEFDRLERRAQRRGRGGLPDEPGPRVRRSLRDL